MSEWRPDHRGQLLGRYVVLERLEASMQSLVYSGSSVVGDHSVEIKLLKPAALGCMTLGGLGANPFSHEYRAAVAIGGDHVVRHLSVGATTQGQPYLVREARSPSGRLPSDRQWNLLPAISIVIDAAEAVMALHELKLVHPQLTTANVEADSAHGDGGPRCRLIDLGELQWMELPGVPGAAKTSEHVTPEEVSAKRLDERCDVFNLGGLLYRLLTASSPFGEDCVGSAALAALFAGEERIPGVRLSEIRDDLFEELDMFLLKVMHRNRDSRPRTVPHFMRGLHHLVSVYAETNPQVQIPGELWHRTSP